MALEVSREHLRAVIFEGWPAKDLHPWMFDDPYGYELEKSNQWDEYTNSLIPVCIRAIFAQYPDYKEDNGSSYKPFKDCFDTLSQKGLLIPEIEQLWNCLLHGRSFFGETPVYFNSLHGYLYNRELAQILEYFPSNQVEFDEVKQKIPAKDKKVERILNAGYLESCIYVREGLIRLCETGLDLFVEAG
ncbi:MAG TPA: hypothetical protein VH186_18620 [Chloroflexia bacterium]|nr:hypothetical protein [Chloroflexia bacterium]